MSRRDVGVVGEHDRPLLAPDVHLRIRDVEGASGGSVLGDHHQPRPAPGSGRGRPGIPAGPGSPSRSSLWIGRLLWRASRLLGRPCRHRSGPGRRLCRRRRRCDRAERRAAELAKLHFSGVHPPAAAADRAAPPGTPDDRRGAGRVLLRARLRRRGGVRGASPRWHREHGRRGRLLRGAPRRSATAERRTASRAKSIRDGVHHVASTTGLCGWHGCRSR